MSDAIICPNCQLAIEVTEVLSAQLRLELRKELEGEIRNKEAVITQREREVARAKEDVARANEDIECRIAEQLAKERKQLSDAALAKAREQVALELQDKDQQLADATAKLQAAQAAELALRKERRELEEQKQTLELTVNRRLDEERVKIRETAKQEAVEERQLKDAESTKLIADLRTQIADLQRKSEQGSQQTQGEVMELDLEDTVRRAFPFDEIIPVPKGIHGGDVVQTIHDGALSDCGVILWESKRTKNWSDGWLPKLRDDQRAAKADIAILVTDELPKGVRNFGAVDGIWVASRSCAIALATALRSGLINVAAARRSVDGQHGKMEVLYNYLSSTQFKQRVEGIVEAFVTMRGDLEAEKRATTRAWAKRAKQLDRAIMQTSGMYGDLSGIIGAGLPSIASLDVPRLESSSDSNP